MMLTIPFTGREDETRGEWCAQAELPEGPAPVLLPLFCTSQEASPEGD